MPKNNLSASIKPLHRESVPSSIINMITDLLISKELKPGDQFPSELELAQQLGVGRNSVREAIKTLSYLGVVEIRRGIGTFVAESMPASVVNPLVLGLILEQKTSREIIELRLLIETAVAEMVIQKAGVEDIQKLEAANGRLRKAATGKSKRSVSLRDLDINFHETLLEVTDNRPLQKIGKVIYTLFLASIEKTVEEDPNLAVRNHQLVIEAIKKRDVELLRKHMKESLSFWMDYIQR
ncbi:MAG: FadR/GntR family transcriptional regulator [Planctomycetota bacterium]|jgi:DNA-binding FadR family transcriptional regulator